LDLCWLSNAEHFTIYFAIAHLHPRTLYCCGFQTKVEDNSGDVPSFLRRNYAQKRSSNSWTY
jgi:hypothetical protein